MISSILLLSVCLPPLYFGNKNIYLVRSGIFKPNLLVLQRTMKIIASIISNIQKNITIIKINSNVVRPEISQYYPVASVALAF